MRLWPFYPSDRTIERELSEALAKPLYTSGVAMIAAERQRQIASEKWSSDHDDIHVDGALAHAAAVYASDRVDVNDVWPWPDEPPKIKDEARNLVRAGALIAAEIDRLQRAAS